MAETLSSGTKVWQYRSRNKQLLSWFIWLIGTAFLCIAGKGFLKVQPGFSFGMPRELRLTSVRA